MKFCPLCANCLLVEEWEKGYKYFCNICDYHYPIHKKIKNKLIFETKKAEDILGGKKAWENVD
jgi:DNA-directed RNA polymerase III subunit RPC11